MARVLTRLGAYMEAFGPTRGATNFLRAKVPLFGEARLRLADGALLHARRRTSDIGTFEQIFVQREYAFDYGVAAPRLIVDAGANVGFAARYFATRFPTARVVAVEPDCANFALLRRNCAGLPGVTPVQGALWHCATALRIANPHDEPWAYRVEASVETRAAGASVPAVTVDELLANSGVECIDILKIDIEGGERELFGGDVGWLSRVRCLVIELHDDVAPGCSRNLYRALSPHPFTQAHRGENILIHVGGDGAGRALSRGAA